MRLRKRRSESLKDTKLGQQRPAIVHVDFVFAGPVKRFAGKNLQAFEINVMALVKLEVTFWKIVADDSDEFDWTEKAGGNRGVAGRTAQQTRIFSFWRFDRIEGSRANNQDTHGCVETLQC